MAVRLIVRVGPKVEKSSHDDLGAALAALRARFAEIRPDRGPVRVLARELAPVQQVAARAEVRGPRGLRGGVDLRGDGSAEAFTGRLRRVVVAPEAREDAYAALARALEGRA